jgi:hypothetical protein
MFDWTSFGKVKFKGEVYNCDVYVDTEMNAHKRSETAKELYGTNHTVGAEELKEILSDDVQALVIGTGQSGCVEIRDEAKKLLDEKNIELHALESPAAIKKYNELCVQKKTMALIHVTC